MRSSIYLFCFLYMIAPTIFAADKNTNSDEDGLCTARSSLADDAKSGDDDQTPILEAVEFEDKLILWSKDNAYIRLMDSKTSQMDAKYELNKAPSLVIVNDHYVFALFNEKIRSSILLLNRDDLSRVSNKTFHNTVVQEMLLFQNGLVILAKDPKNKISTLTLYERPQSDFVDKTHVFDEVITAISIDGDNLFAISQDFIYKMVIKLNDVENPKSFIMKSKIRK